ncbi:YesL family protein [Paenibacillus tarimensis]|uniref:YesL family protein n=1 Tax=Paenibacillus tarimensis TaxID=416012 RepID=UPI001F182A80|nr:DUF624 domain-containing protein [Paenibacillus tarimensis]MCF2943226.1 DUF624 domain-containing protein [Paenibacillus tarimensis]
MEMRGLMGGFYKISEWIMRLSVTNVLWVICSLPFLYLLLVPLFFSQTIEQLISGLLVSALAAPFFFFPATAALFTVARKWVMGEVEAPLLKTFFRGYKENYVKSMLGGLLYTLIFVIIGVDYWVYYSGMEGLQLLSYIFMGIGILLVISLFNFFSMIVHYHMKTVQLVKNAILITIGRPIRAVSTVVIAAAAIFISINFTFLFPFFTGSVIAYMAFFNFYQVFLKLKEQQEKQEQEALEGQEQEMAEQETKRL